MAKLVILSQGLTGKTHELKVDKTTIGRVEDNTFPIVEPSISSHHCEILLRGSDVVVKDLNSTNGTFINGDKITGEAVLKPGQILRLGQIELRLETDAPAGPAGAKKPVDSTMVVQRGVSLTELETGARGGFDTATTGFSKKKSKGNRIFLIAAVVVGVIIIALVLVALMSASKPSP
jgi:pSer/pThr/pTyr-binding forkhead associated (FHA) protein